MTRYAKYENAKIAYPKSMILVRNGYFDAMENIATSQINMWEECDPREHCITVKQFLKDGYKFVEGDIVFEGRVKKLFNEAVARGWNEIQPKLVPNAYVLRAVALENTITTQTPEEKEAFDLIDTTPHQYEMGKFSNPKEVEWSDDDELPPLGCEVMTSYTDNGCDDWCDFHGPSKIIAYHGDYVWVAHHGKFHRVHELCNVEFKKPESPEAKEKRERLEAAYDLYCTGNKGLNVTAPCTFDAFESDEIQCKFWLAIVDKTNYRKGE